ncbi:MAG: SGNH/GDSL hydrolase family protein [Clostridia bacterium]|nr:SGNH/GDSL hydrolase family protein [Clostridia bacterium]
MKILFQGDSITDAGRDRSDVHNLGNGYPKFTAELIRNRHPGTDFEFINLGISGNRAENLRDRWQADCIDLQPDVVSILIGVNDTWHRAGDKNWMPHDYFEECYRFILSEIKEKTNAKIIMIEQFLLYTPDKDFFHVDLDAKIQVTRKLAREFADVFIPMDGIFASHCIGTEPTKWAGDGVHPTEAGARLIAGYYADAFDKLFASIH